VSFFFLVLCQGSDFSPEGRFPPVFGGKAGGGSKGFPGGGERMRDFFSFCGKTSRGGGVLAGGGGDHPVFLGGGGAAGQNKNTQKGGPKGGDPGALSRPPKIFKKKKSGNKKGPSTAGAHPRKNPFSAGTKFLRFLLCPQPVA